MPVINKNNYNVNKIEINKKTEQYKLTNTSKSKISTNSKAYKITVNLLNNFCFFLNSKKKIKAQKIFASKIDFTQKFSLQKFLQKPQEKNIEFEFIKQRFPCLPPALIFAVEKALIQNAALEEICLILERGEKAQVKNPQDAVFIQPRMIHAINNLGETSALAAKVGSKAANLHRLDKLFPGLVPLHQEICHEEVLAYVRQKSPLFDTLWQSVVDHLKQGHSIETADHLLNPLQAEIERIFAESSDFPKDAYLEKFQSSGEPLIVRSSSREDTLKVANQGGGTSVPNILPNREAIQKANPFGIVISSYFSKKSLTQRMLQGDNITELPFMAVTIQTMKKPSVSGVMFSTEGELGTPGVCQISADFGFAGVVTGSRPSDTYYVQDQFIHAIISEKFVHDVPQEDGTLAAINNSPDQQKSPCLSNKQVLQLAKIAQRIEQEYGYPMDIEWGYDTQTDSIYLFQARPIPLKANSNPSYLDPEKIGDLNNRQYVTVIGAGSGQVRTLTKENTLMANSAPLALKEYLAHPDRPCEAIFLANPTAVSSHEAGFFRQKGIPVIYLSQNGYSQVKTSLTNQTLLLDTQEGFLGFLPQERQAQDFICKGLRHHVIPKMESQVRKLTPKEEQAFQTNLAEKALHIDLKDLPKVTGRNQIELLLNAFEKARRVEEKAYILQQLLKKVEVILKKAPESERQEIWQKVLYNAHHVWKICQNPQMEEVNQKFAMSWLRTALLGSPKEGIVQAGTFRQALEGIKERQKLKLEMKESTDSVEYRDIFQRSKKLIYTPETRKKWEIFISTLKDEELPRLATIFNTLGPHLIETWLNLEFRSIDDLHQFSEEKSSKILDTAIQRVLKQDKIQQILSLSDRAKAINAQFKESDFSDPNQFNILHQNLKSNLLSLTIECTQAMENASGMDAAILAQTFGSLVTTFDACIKKLTESTSYDTPPATPLQKAKNFGLLLKSYLALAKASMTPNMLKSNPALAQQASFLVPFLEEKLPILQKLAEEDPEKALIASSRFSVAMAALGSGALAPDRMPPESLEEFFTLIHQSLITVEQVVNHCSGISQNQLPPLLNQLCQQIMQLNLRQTRYEDEPYQRSPTIQNINYHYPNITVTFNAPLSIHSAQFIVEAIVNPEGEITSLVFEGRFFAAMNMMGIAQRAETLQLYALESYYNTPSMKAPEGFQIVPSTTSSQFKWDLTNSQSWQLAYPQLQKMIDFIQNIRIDPPKIPPNLIKENPWTMLAIKMNLQDHYQSQIKEITTEFMQGIVEDFTNENKETFMKLYRSLFQLNHTKNELLNTQLLGKIIDLLLEDDWDKLTNDQYFNLIHFFVMINPNRKKPELFEKNFFMFKSYHELFTSDRIQKLQRQLPHVQNLYQREQKKIAKAKAKGYGISGHEEELSQFLELYSPSS